MPYLTTNSMRRFCALPSSVSLLATGRSLPKPTAVMRSFGIPALMK
jgi:hypothetical protein